MVRCIIGTGRNVAIHYEMYSVAASAGSSNKVQGSRISYNIISMINTKGWNEPKSSVAKVWWIFFTQKKVIINNNYKYGLF